MTRPPPPLTTETTPRELSSEDAIKVDTTLRLGVAAALAYPDGNEQCARVEYLGFVLAAEKIE